MYLCYLHAEALGEAEHDDVDAIGIADEVVVEHEVVLVPGELPDADLTHAAQTDALHADAQGVRGEAPGPACWQPRLTSPESISRLNFENCLKISKSKRQERK